MQSHAKMEDRRARRGRYHKGKAAHVIAESRWEFHEGILFQSAVDQEGHSCTSDLIEGLVN